MKKMILFLLILAVMSMSVLACGGKHKKEGYMQNGYSYDKDPDTSRLSYDVTCPYHQAGCQYHGQIIWWKFLSASPQISQ